ELEVEVVRRLGERALVGVGSPCRLTHGLEETPTLEGEARVGRVDLRQCCERPLRLRQTTRATQRRREQKERLGVAGLERQRRAQLTLRRLEVAATQLGLSE